MLGNEAGIIYYVQQARQDGFVGLIGMIYMLALTATHGHIHNTIKGYRHTALLVSTQHPFNQGTVLVPTPESPQPLHGTLAILKLMTFK